GDAMKAVYGSARVATHHSNRNASPSRVSSFAAVTCLTEPSPLSTGEGVWEPGPPDLRLTDGVLHVWRADLDAVPGEVTELLSARGRARAGRLRSPLKAERWSRGRGVVRELLGRYLETDPRTLRLKTGAPGKPVLGDGCEREPRASDDISARRPRPS